LGVAGDSGTTPWLNGNGVTQADRDAINAWIAQAASNATAADLANITLYTPSLDPSTYSCPSGCPNTPAQEFIVVKAVDAPALASLGLNLLALGALVLIARKRIIHVI
jgi:hypothetical protein